MNLGQYWFSDNDVGYLIDTNDIDLVVGSELTESHHSAFVDRFRYEVSEIMPLERQQANERGAGPTGDTYRRFGLPSIGVYANQPLTRLDDPIAERIPGGLPGFRVRVDADDASFVLYALHIPRGLPFGSPAYRQPMGQFADMVEAIDDAIREESLPVVLLGDLNLSDRGPGYRTLTSSLSDGMRASGWALPTADRPLPWSLLFLRIDHLLLSEELCTSEAFAIDTRFSDHRPLVADVGLCPDGDEATAYPGSTTTE